MLKTNIKTNTSQAKPFDEYLSEAAKEYNKIIGGYKLLKAVNPRNEEILTDYINQSERHKTVIENAIKSGEV